jgi:beta-galactosidase
MKPFSPEKGREYFLSFYAQTREAGSMVPAGHRVAQDQFALTPGEQSQPTALAAGGAEQVKVIESKEGLLLQFADGKVEFDRSSGDISAYVVNGKALLEKGPRPNTWRAPTENDFGNNMHRRMAIWRTFGKELQLQSLVPVQTDAETMVLAEYIHPEYGCHYQVEYMVDGKGVIRVHAKFDPLNDGLPDIPRFGMHMVLPAGLENLEYFGRGPHENYNDRNHSSLVGRYKSTVTEQYVRYNTNGENGNKTDVRWLTLTDESGVGIRIEGDPVIDFSALHFSIDELDREERDGPHPTDMQVSELVFLNVDLEQMGVGGDDSWGAKTHAQYMIYPEPLEYSYVISPVLSD